MRTVVLRSPWASLVAEGRKTVELRTWSTRYRGPLLIIAGKGVDRADVARWGHRDAPRGVSLCVVDLIDVRPATSDDEHVACCPIAVGEFAWIVANPRPVTQLPMLGRLGLYEVEITPEALGLRASDTASPLA
jgi:hypothetical protein